MTLEEELLLDPGLKADLSIRRSGSFVGSCGSEVLLVNFSFS